MSDSLALQNRIPTELIARAKAVVGLLTVAIVHILDLHDTLEETPLVGYGYLVLIAVSLAAAALLMTVVDQRIWAVVGVIAAGALLAYLLSRTTGIPGDSDDVAGQEVLLHDRGHQHRGRRRLAGWLADALVAPASPHGTARRRAGRGGFRPLLELHALISSHQFTCESNGALPCPATCLRASPGGVSSPPPH